VGKFQLIAENATAYAEIAKAAKQNDGAERAIRLKDDRSFTYAEATKELHRLIDEMMEEKTGSQRKLVLRKQINSLSLALYNFTRQLETQSAETAQFISIITTNIKDIIIAFQFHDFVNQRLTHIRIVFEMFQKKADELIRAYNGNSPGNGVSDAMAKELIESFFLSDVQQSFLKHLDADQVSRLQITAVPSQSEDDIELF